MVEDAAVAELAHPPLPHDTRLNPALVGPEALAGALDVGYGVVYAHEYGLFLYAVVVDVLGAGDHVPLLVPGRGQRGKLLHNLLVLYQKLNKWSDRSTTSYAMPDFESEI